MYNGNKYKTKGIGYNYTTTQEKILRDFPGYGTKINENSRFTSKRSIPLLNRYFFLFLNGPRSVCFVPCFTFS
jgi:hypothetical protein